MYPAADFVSDATKVIGDKTIKLILIATPTSAHYALAKAALEASKHVFIKKPMCATELNQLARRQASCPA